MAAARARSAVSAARTNYAALHYWPAAFRPSANGQLDLELPASHPRTAYWQAAWAKNAADWETLLALMQPLADQGDRYALGFVGLAYESQGDYPPAIQAWEQLADAAALIRVAKAAQAAGQTEIALQAYTTAWDIDPRNATSPYASFLQRNDDLAAAERVLREGLGRVPPYSRTIPYLHRSLANLLMGQERWAEATVAWEDVLRSAYLFYNSESHMDQVYYQMAWAYHMNGQPGEATAAIEQALVQNPTTPFFLRAGQIYETAGEREKALHAYRQVLIIDPQNETALDAIRRLQSGP